MTHPCARLGIVASLSLCMSLYAAAGAPVEFEAGSLHMIDRHVGWVVPARMAPASGDLNPPTLLRTIDGGESWKPVLHCGTNDLMAEYVRDSQTAWAAVVKNYDELSNTIALYRTDNGGQSWIKSDIAQPDPIEFAFLDFSDAHIGWLMLIPDHGMNSSPGCLYRTDSGGASWHLVNRVDQSDGDPDDRLRQEASQSRLLPHLPYGGQILFQNAKTGWLWGAATTTTPRFLSESRDGGRTWRVLNFPLADKRADGLIEPLGLPRFFSGGHHDGILCAQFRPTNQEDADFRTVIYKTHDAGRTWHEVLALKAFGAFDFITEKQGWFWSMGAEGPGQFYHTDDGALSWKPVGPAYAQKPFVHHRRIAQLNFVDDQFGWALAQEFNDEQSELLKTSDGGAHWAIVQATLTR